jgi:hypothetical protein
MAKKSSYWEGWGFSDRIPMYFSATKRNIEKLISELKKTYPENPVEQVNPRVLQVMATDNDVKNMKRIATLFNAQLVYAEGGQLEGMGISPLDANPYVAGAKTAKAIAPKSVDALDIRLASKINPDPMRPIFFSKGGNIADQTILESYKKAVSQYIKERYNEEVDWENSFILINKTAQGTKIKDSAIESKSGKEYKINPEELFNSYANGGRTLTWKNKYNKQYGYSTNEPHSLSEISKDTGVSLKGLQQIYNKGIGAYKTNPNSVRPNVKSKEQWAMARVYSAVMGGKASKIDSNELIMSQGGIAPTIGGTMETSMTDAPMIGGTMASSLFAEGGTTNSTTIAKVILEQLGGVNKLVVMTGAYNFVALPDGVYFKIKNRKVNYVKIRLNEKDLYDILFGKIISGKVKAQSEHFDVYFDELKPIFEKETGMYLNF